MSRSKTSRHTHEKRSAASKSRIPKWLVWVIVAALALVPLVLVFLPTRSERPVFDADRAFADLVRQVEFGARVPGSPAHARTLTFLTDTLSRYADQVGTQPLTYRDPTDSTRVYQGTNIVASFNLNPASGRRVMLAAHWDTRAGADQDPNPAKRTMPVPGANDGASGVAVLLEMARVLSREQPEVGVDLVFFDLEDIGREEQRGDTAWQAVPYAVGSHLFVQNNPGYRPSYGILLDMVCDKNLRLPMEANSVRAAGQVVRKVWDAAERVGAEAFVDEIGQPVYDDHIPFLQRGIPVIDVIQTPFPPYWHTTADTPDNCSGASLKQVGDTMVEVIYSEE